MIRSVCTYLKETRCLAASIFWYFLKMRLNCDISMVKEQTGKVLCESISDGT